MKIIPIEEDFVARIEGIDTAAATAPDIDAIREAMVRYAVVVLPGQHLSAEKQIAFAKAFGPLDVNDVSDRYNAGVNKELIEVANVDQSNTRFERESPRRLVDLGNRFWHSDSSYKHVPAHLSMLYGVKVAGTGGQTEFADLRAAYDALPVDLLALIDGRIAEHSGLQGRFLLGFDNWLPEERAMLERGARHPLIRTLPESGRKTLYLSTHAARILDMPVPESRVLINELIEFATTQANTYAHAWAANDLVIWDNRCTMHRLRRYDAEAEQRVLRRATTADQEYLHAVAAE